MYLIPLKKKNGSRKGQIIALPKALCGNSPIPNLSFAMNTKQPTPIQKIMIIAIIGTI